MNAKQSILLVLVFWGMFLVLWPTPVNDHASHEFDPATHKSGEGLYKASLTRANFGLLGVRFYESTAGRRHWEIRSKFAELHRKENYAFLTDVDARFFAEKTGNTVLTKSDNGSLWTEKNLIELWGNVSIESKRGYRFEMERVNYWSSEHKFRTDTEVRMSGPNPARPTMFLRGKGMVADIDREHFFIERNVTAQRKLKNSGWLKIQAKNGQFFTDESRAVFMDKVRSHLPDLQLESDILELTLDDETEKIYAQGNVVLRNKDRVGYADTADIKAGTDEIVLKGKARIESPDNRLEGQTIYLYTNDDRIEVIEASGKQTK